MPIPDRERFSSYEDYKINFRRNFPSGYPLLEEEFYKSRHFLGAERHQAEIESQDSKMYYPIVLRPGALDSILSATPPLPENPELPAQPNHPKKPSPPSPPQTVERPKSRWFYFSLITGLACLLFIFFPGILSGLSFILLTLIGAIDPIYFFKIRLANHRQKEKEYDKAYVKYSRKKEEWDSDGESRIRCWEKECQNIDSGWKRELREIKEAYQAECEEITQSDSIQEWRLRESLNVAESALGFEDLIESDAKVGKLDNDLYSALTQNFPDLDIVRNKKTMWGCDRGYTPDAAVHDPEAKIHLDIEIDEPWFLKDGSRKSCHYIGKDTRRNNFFNSEGWVVIRFSECQFYDYPESCMKLIARELDRFRFGSIEKLESRFLSTPDLPKVAQWTKEEATQIPRRS